MSSAVLSSPTLSKDPHTRPLRRGDLVRVSEVGLQTSKRLKDRAGQLGRIIKYHENETNKEKEEEEEGEMYYDVEWVMGGRTCRCRRTELMWTCAEFEGMTTNTQREKRKPTDFMSETIQKDVQKRKVPSLPKETTLSKKRKLAPPPPLKKPLPAQTKRKPNLTAAEKSKSKGATTAAKRRTQTATIKATKPTPATTLSSTPLPTTTPSASLSSPSSTAMRGGMDLYEKHRREFERIFHRLQTKIDLFRHFWADNHHPIPPEPYNEIYTTAAEDPVGDTAQEVPETKSHHPTVTTTTVFPAHAPYNWEMIQRRMNHGRYVLDRLEKEERERNELLAPYFASLSKGDKSAKKRKKSPQKAKKNPPPLASKPSHRVICPKGVHWELFRSDVLAMCQAALERQAQQKAHPPPPPGPDDEEDDDDDDQGQRGSLSYTVRKIQEAVQQAVERTGHRHASEMAYLDDRYKFGLAMESALNTEPAMQSWRKVPFPERQYERLQRDVVCAGLSQVDAQIAAFELQTKLPDSFIGQSYRYDDTGQSEAWMKSVVDETGSHVRPGKSSAASSHNNKKGGGTPKGEAEERMAALALAADEGVVRAQVSATMQSLLMAIQDRVMTEWGVLRQPELRSANWMTTAPETPNDELLLPPEVVEQPVWGIDCYTRRNILNCLNIEFDPATSLLFVEKWLLPAINACPARGGHNIANAARILEGLPLEDIDGEELPLAAEDAVGHATTTLGSSWNESLLGRALCQKIAVSAPPWLPAAANQLRRARRALGPDFFRVHPKGHGSVVLSPSGLKPNTLVTFYRGELYPSWRWGEKMDAIDITQSRKDLKPALPDFYNMALERPQTDPRGYGLLFVDASRKAGHGSSLSHSCAPTCEVRVAACEGELCLAMTTLRALEMGEELTFDYNAVTESLNEYRSAVCLCGYGKCRGSFLHFATADCYQQVLNRNSPIASRFASLIKGSMKQVMSPDDELIQRNHGFRTAAFGAISVNRHDTSSEDLVDSLDMVPIWLRTYVADALRYIEYERRALPIALICEHLSASKKENSKLSATPLTKEPKPEPMFFYFTRTQSDFIRELLNKEGFPESLSGLQLRHAMQKVASNYWSSLSDEQKKYWKDQAQLDYEKKMKAWRGVAKQISGDEKKRDRNKSKPPEIEGILHSSKISFQDADAEGVAAMEQRIQQLTQTLSRVGRVLDRHREETFGSNPGKTNVESMRKRVPAPLRVLTDKEVIDWIWNNNEGVVLSFLREVECSRFVRPCLLNALREVRQKFSSLETDDDLKQLGSGRQQLKVALLKLRSVLRRELKEMAKEYRQLRAQSTTLQSDETNYQDSAVLSDSESEENIPPVAERNELNAFENSETIVPVPVSSKRSEDMSSNDTNANMLDEADVSKINLVNHESHPWLDFYSERFVLHVASDLLLMYANTSNFFAIQPYLPLESTPIEVYARELGNEVPRSVVDVGLSSGSSNGTDAIDITSTEVNQIRNENKERDSSFDKPGDGAAVESNVKRQSSELCAPDDIVAKVTVRYDGHYVTSQLLQWYNAGIGQKPGLPDLLGCTLLPSMSDCWSSELLKKSKIKAASRTTYEVKIRPRLVEWMQDPYQRGNPWPPEIRKAFVGEGPYNVSVDSSMAFGSPVIDFLVMGDESNIISVLNALDVDDKVTAKTSAAGLLTSVDKGRPAQAVSTWVQCEHPTCMKWRKIPWYVDADVLPERFYCEDNKWNPQASSCDVPEDDWDGDDAMVGSDGKVEGSPVNKRKFEGSLPVDEESSFRVGTRFDVKRSDKDIFSVASVVKADFSGTVKRIMFHYAKTSSDRDEWVEFGSSRIAPLYSKVPKKRNKVDSNLPQATTGTGSNQVALSHDKNSLKSDTEALVENDLKDNSLPKESRPKEKPVADPTDEKSFVVGARFDVFRVDKKRYFFARVVDVDFNGLVKKICFRFTKTKDNHTEWFELGSPHICPFRSKVLRIKRKARKIENGLSGTSSTMQTSIEPASEGNAIHINLEVPKETQSNESVVSMHPDLDVSRGSIRDVYEFASTLAALSSSESNEKHLIPQGHTFPAMVPGQLNLWQTNQAVPQTTSSSDLVSYRDKGDASKQGAVENCKHGSISRNDFATEFANLPSHMIYQRPPDFVTHSPNVASFSLNSNQMHQQQNGENTTMHGYSMMNGHASSESVMPAAPSDWSGLDMLAAVTFEAAASMVSSSSCSNGITPTSTISSMTAATPCDWGSSNYPPHSFSSLWHTQHYVPGQHSFYDGRYGLSSYGSLIGGNNANDFSRPPSSNNESSKSNHYG